MIESLHKKEALSTFTTTELKTENEIQHSYSRQILRMLPVHNPPI